MRRYREEEDRGRREEKPRAPGSRAKARAATLARFKEAFVRVGGGRGFVVESHRRVVVQRRLLVVTAAHCLPTDEDGKLMLPPPHPFSHTEARTFANLLGPLDEKPTVWAECLFVDPVADIAILGEPDNQVFSDEAEAYGALVGARRPLHIGSTTGTPGRPVTAWLLTLADSWISCKVHQFPPRSPLSIAGATEGYAPGTSGCPVITSDGEAIGVISLGDIGNPVLVDSLPGWALRQIVQKRK